MPRDGAIGGAPVLTLTAPRAGDRTPRFTSVQILPGRAMMLLQARCVIPRLGEIDIIASPSLEEGARRLSGGQGDEWGNAAFAFGGAVLAPFANRIRGRETIGEQSVETRVAGKTVRLPANWGGKGPGAELYAMHGLILDRAVDVLHAEADRATGRILAGDFDGRWPGRLDIAIDWTLSATALRLVVTAHNVGDEPSPVGLGWHPYLALPSGDRKQARLKLPAQSRVVVNNYDEVLPTGEVAAVAGTPYDFRPGEALGDLYLDDCFCDLERNDAGETAVEVTDPAAGYGVRVVSPSAAVSAVQVFAPVDKPFVVVEPQFNLADPFGAEWGDRATGMALLQPGEQVAYEARIELMARPDPLHA